jgi:hypothetical protein
MSCYACEDGVKWTLTFKMKVTTWILHDRLGYRWIPSGNLCYYGGYEANP